MILRVAPQYNDEARTNLESLLYRPRLLRHIVWWHLERDFLSGRHAVITADALEELVVVVKHGAGPNVHRFVKALRAAELVRKQGHS